MLDRSAPRTYLNPMRISGVAAIPLILGCAARQAAPPAPQQPESAALRIEGPHITVVGRPDHASREEAEALASQAEDAYARLTTLLVERQVPEHLVVRLQGPGDMRQGRVPTVDIATGELWLYTFEGQHGGYGASMTHEMVHALRHHLWTDPTHQTDPFLFFEEALAELLATEAGSPSEGFPRYGFPLPIAAGAWIAGDEDIPIPDLIRDHKGLNFRCMAQSYTLRLSFVTSSRSASGCSPSSPSDIRGSQ